MNLLKRSACLIVALSSLAAAPARGVWDEVQSLRNGKQVKVATKAKAFYKGTFQSLTAESLVVLEGTTERSIPRADVAKVEAQSNNRVRNAVIGAAVGVAIGVVIDQSFGAYARNEIGESAGTRAATIIVPAAAIGGLSALMPTYRNVYRAPK